MSITFYLPNAPTIPREVRDDEDGSLLFIAQDSWAPEVNMANGNAHMVCALAGIELSEDGCGVIDATYFVLSRIWDAIFEYPRNDPADEYVVRRLVQLHAVFAKGHELGMRVHYS